MAFKTRDRHHSTVRRQNIESNTKLIWSKHNNIIMTRTILLLWNVRTLVLQLEAQGSKTGKILWHAWYYTKPRRLKIPGLFFFSSTENCPSKLCSCRCQPRCHTCLPLQWHNMTGTWWVSKSFGAFQWLNRVWSSPLCL